MPGKRPAPPEPVAFLVEYASTPGPMWINDEEASPHIEAFPNEVGQFSPRWVSLPRRKVVALTNVMALPVGARKVPLYDPTGDARLISIRPGSAGGRRFLFVSEGFGDDGFDRFAQAAERMAAGLLKNAPFDQAAGSIRIEALYLPLRGGAVVNIGCRQSPADVATLRPTLFGTQSCVGATLERLWAGDEDRVRTLAERALGTMRPPILLADFDFVAVLIDSDVYGGAGSVDVAAKRPRIAWATTGHADSIEILLHELGHAFGLQDEYEDKYEGPPKPWRNISAHPEPKNTPWQSLVTEERDSLTLATGGSWTGRNDGVGTFEGAGYESRHRFRPSVDCRMRHLGKPFCPVCAAVIHSKLDPTIPTPIAEEQ
ncbi:MAG: M64 family metallopeptidase [Sphingomicrobium sp.]